MRATSIGNKLVTSMPSASMGARLTKGASKSTATSDGAGGEDTIDGVPLENTAKGEERAAALKLEVAEKPFVPLLVLSALTVAFAHGANDVRTTRGLAHCPHITGRCVWVGAL